MKRLVGIAGAIFGLFGFSPALIIVMVLLRRNFGSFIDPITEDRYTLIFLSG